MLFILQCDDAPDSPAKRKATRGAHLEYLRGHGAAVFVAGPLLADDGRTPIGSVLIIDVADRDAAQRFADDDPYRKAGVFARVRIAPWVLGVYNPRN
jgi:uncharacterized protein YciI